MPDILLIIAWLFALSAACEVVWQKLYPRNHILTEQSVRVYASILRRPSKDLTRSEADFVQSIIDAFAHHKIDIITPLAEPKGLLETFPAPPT